MSAELAKDLGVKLKFVQSSFPTLINDVNTNKCDIGMFAIGNTDSRRILVIEQKVIQIVTISLPKR